MAGTLWVAVAFCAAQLLTVNPAMWLDPTDAFRRRWIQVGVLGCGSACPLVVQHALVLVLVLVLVPAMTLLARRGQWEPSLDV